MIGSQFAKSPDVARELSNRRSALPQKSWAMTESHQRRAFLAKRGESITVYVDDSLGKSLRGFLREIVSDAARNSPVLVLAGELLRIRTGMRMRRAFQIVCLGS